MSVVIECSSRLNIRDAMLIRVAHHAACKPCVCVHASRRSAYHADLGRAHDNDLLAEEGVKKRGRVTQSHVRHRLFNFRFISGHRCSYASHPTSCHSDRCIE